LNDPWGGKTFHWKLGRAVTRRLAHQNSLGGRMFWIRRWLRGFVSEPPRPECRLSVRWLLQDSHAPWTRLFDLLILHNLGRFHESAYVVRSEAHAVRRTPLSMILCHVLVYYMS
jgi:hypothetical protein